MVRPERRRRADLVAALVIALVVAVGAGLIWWTSDARATESRPAAEPVKPVVPAKAVPETLRQLWTAPSAHTTIPVVAGGAVVTGDGRTVTGHDPVTGQTLWTFARDRELCGVSWLYHYAVAVYPDSRGCGQVSTIDGSTGRRGATRSGYADKHVDLSSDGTTVLSAGASRLELWRSDMVRVIGYGEVDARIKPAQVGVGAGCDILSAASSTSAVSLMQSCAGSGELQVTLLRAADQDDEPDLRDVPLNGVKAESGARVLAVSDTSTAVYLPTPRPRVVVYDETGSEESSADLAAPPTPAGLQHSAVSQAAGLITWWTGNSLVVFDANRLAYRYTIPAVGPTTPLGPATTMADKLLVPVTGGVGVYEASAGTLERVIPVDRPATQGPVVSRVAGTTLLEQRGGNLVALG
jgi:hypothetical protein